MARLLDAPIFDLIPESPWRTEDLAGTGDLEKFYDALENFVEDWHADVLDVIGAEQDIDTMSELGLHVLAWRFGLNLPSASIPRLRQFLYQSSEFRSWKGNFGLMESAIFAAANVFATIEVPWQQEWFTIGSSAIAVQAQLVIQDLTYSAVLFGAAGNIVEIEYQNNGPSLPLQVILVDSDTIIVQLETDGGGASISTASEVKTAIDSSGASNLVTVSISGTAGDVQVAEARQNLAGGSGDPIGLDYRPESQDTYVVGISLVGLSSIGTKARNAAIPYTFIVRLLLQPTGQQQAIIDWVLNTFRRAIDKPLITYPDTGTCWVIGESQIGIDSVVCAPCYVVGFGIVGGSRICGGRIYETPEYLVFLKNWTQRYLWI